jgi:purine nucleoside phosphorylase
VFEYLGGQHELLIIRSSIEADQNPLWNAPELARVIRGDDEDAPTLANMLRKAAKAVRDDSANFVRSGPRAPSPAERLRVCGAVCDGSGVQH